MSKKRLSIVSVVGCAGAAIAFVVSASAQQQPVPVGVDVLELPWGQIAAMITVVSVIFAAIQWVLTVVLVQPQIRDAVGAVDTGVRAWVSKEFTPVNKYEIHLLEDKQVHALLAGQIADIVHDASRDNERIAVLHDKAILHDGQIDRLSSEAREREQRLARIERGRSFTGVD